MVFQFCVKDVGPENVSSNQSSTLVAVCEVTQSCCYQTLEKVEGLVKIFFSANLCFVPTHTFSIKIIKKIRTNDSCRPNCSPKGILSACKCFNSTNVITPKHMVFFQMHFNKSVPHLKTIYSIHGSALQFTLHNPIDF